MIRVLWQALRHTILLTACVHLLLLIAEAVQTGNWYLLTIPDILDLYKFFPSLQNTPMLSALTFLPLLVAFAWHMRNAFRARSAGGKK